jgi:GNAT superfamily N-acetyltransferase
MVGSDMDKIEYRPACDSDLGALTELWWHMQSSHDAYAPRFYKNIGAEKCKDLCYSYFKDLLRKEDSMIYVVTSSSTPVGMIVAHFRTRPPVYDISRVVEVEVAVVDPNYRRRGIFRKLLAVVENKAKLAGVEMVEIMVDHDNPDKPAYEKTGFSLRQDKMVKWP